MDEEKLQQIDRILGNRFLWAFAVACTFVMIVIVLICMICIEGPLFFKRLIHDKRLKNYRERMQNTATCIPLDDMALHVHRQEYVVGLKQWCDDVGISLHVLEGPFYQALPEGGRAVVLDLASPYFAGTNKLHFLTKSDATLYKLTF